MSIIKLLIGPDIERDTKDDDIVTFITDIFSLYIGEIVKNSEIIIAEQTRTNKKEIEFSHKGKYYLFKNKIGIFKIGDLVKTFVLYRTIQLKYPKFKREEITILGITKKNTIGFSHNGILYEINNDLQSQIEKNQRRIVNCQD